MAIKITVDGKTYEGVDVITVGGKVLTLAYVEDSTGGDTGGDSGGTTAKNYTITNNLTNCTNSNKATSVQEGKAYSGAITADSGYELQSVTVTMGGSPVSVSGGVFSIPAVTGNIVITVVAVEISTGGGEEGDGGETEENNGWTNGVEYADPVWTSGYEIDSTGELVESDVLSVSDFVPCKGVDAFTTTNNLGHNIWLYDDNKNYIGALNIPKTGIPVATYLLKNGKTPAYFRSTFRTSNVDLGKTTPFIVPLKLPVATPTTVMSAGELYAPEFFVNKTAWSGVEKDEAGAYCTNYIFVYGFESITINETAAVNRKSASFYDAEKNYISGEANNNVTRTIPDGAFYCRISSVGYALPSYKWWIRLNEATEV